MRRQLMVCALLLGGCADASLAWEYSIDPGVSEPALIGAHVRNTSCDGPRRVSYFFARGEEAPVTPAPLDEGTFCFEVEAYDDTCVVLGRGTQALELPGDAAVVRVPVAPVTDGMEDTACLSFLAR